MLASLVFVVASHALSVEVHRRIIECLDGRRSYNDEPGWVKTGATWLNLGAGAGCVSARAFGSPPGPVPSPPWQKSLTGTASGFTGTCTRSPIGTSSSPGGQSRSSKHKTTITTTTTTITITTSTTTGTATATANTDTATVS